MRWLFPRRASRLATLFVLGLSSSSAFAQPKLGAKILPTLPTPRAPLKPGTWAQYSLVNLKINQAVLVRIAALEMQDGAQWLEIKFTDSRRRFLLVKSLVEGGLSAPKKILKTIVQPQGQLPLLLPDRVAAQAVPPFQSGPGDKSRFISRGKVKVPAGTFTADLFRTGEGASAKSVWLSLELPIWPLIKTQSQELLLELVGRGDGAKSEVRGKPTKIDEKFFEQLMR
jgi:hypothetical protein